MAMTKMDRPVVIPAGEYYLGDPCYTVRGQNWSDLLDTCNCFADPVGTLPDGKKVYALGTQWGDGSYEAWNIETREHAVLPVDAGLIGLTPVDSEYVTEPTGNYVGLVKRVKIYEGDEMTHDGRSILFFGDWEVETGEPEEE